MPPTPIRQRIRTFLSPKVADFLVAETEDTSRKTIPEFGTPHPDASRYPNHKFCYAVASDDQGLIDTFLYAAPREDQDDYNWEHTSADIGGTKFDAIRRSYVIPRADFTPDTPAQGAVNPNVPAGKFTGTHYLAEKKQIRIGDKELDALFVVEERLYVKKVSLANVTLSPENGRAKRAISTWYYRGETISGTPIETLAANPGNAYWGQQSDAAGTFRELKSESEDWFVVTESTMVAGDGAANGTGNPAKSRTRNYPTPSVLDYIVRETGTDAANLAYGTAHYDTATYPNHKLSYKRPVEGSGGLLFEFFYTAPRANQDAYNARHTGSDSLSRIYVFPRASYPAALGTITFGTNDPQYGDRYQFTHEELIDVDQELHGVFVMVRRNYQQLVKVDYILDDEFNLRVKRTVELVEHTDPVVAPTQVVGKSIELAAVNTFYDQKTTLELVADSGTLSFPVQLDTLPTTVNKSLPPVLQSVKLVSAYAYAASSGAAAAYAEDFYFDPIINDPFPGPYQGRILRFLTDDPESYISRYPIDQWVEVADTIPIVAAWWLASPDGNSANAIAKQITLRPTVHAEIPIEGIETLAIVQSKPKLPMTPGFRNFASMGTITVDINPKKTRYGLTIVEIYQANLRGAYGGIRGDFDDESGTSGAGDNVTDTTPIPVVYTGTISSDNSTISGLATPGAAIVAIYAGVEIGKVMSNAQGAYSLPLQQPYYTDPVDLLVKARKSGILSGALVITTRDLSPETPTASISDDLTTVSGNAQPASTITISMTSQPQVETATVVGTILTDGQAKLVLTSARVTGSPVTVLVDAVAADTASVIAGRFRAAMTSDASINDVFAISGTGANVVITKRGSFYDDPTLNMATDNESCTGLTPAATSANTTQGLGTVTTTADSGGAYTYTFTPALPNGTELSITASDLGGSSPPVAVTADANPPLITATPVFTTDSFTEITGAVTVAGGTPAAGTVTVTSYFGDTVLQSDTNDASGNFAITLTTPRYRGEGITLIAALTADLTVRSPAVTVDAANLNLPVPVFEESAGEYIGTAPDPGSYAPLELYKLVVRYELTSEEVEFDVFASNNEFTFNFDDFTGNIGNQNGERYEVFFRFDTNPGGSPYLVDGESAYINSPVVTLDGAVIGVFPPGLSTVTNNNWAQDWPGALNNGSGVAADGDYTSQAFYVGAGGRGTPTFFPRNKTLAVWLRNPLPGTTVQIKFPGQDVADIAEATYTAPIYMANIPAFPFTYVSGVGTRPVPPWPSPVQNGAAGFYQNTTPIPTRDQIRLAMPARLRIIIRSPDGRSIEQTWARDQSYPWTDTQYMLGNPLNV